MRNISAAETMRKKAAKKSTGKKRGRPKKVEFSSLAKEKVFVPTTTTASQMLIKREKNAFDRNFGEGAVFDLDYGKLLIIALCIFIAVQVS